MPDDSNNQPADPKDTTGGQTPSNVVGGHPPNDPPPGVPPQGGDPIATTTTTTTQTTTQTPPVPTATTDVVANPTMNAPLKSQVDQIIAPSHVPQKYGGKKVIATIFGVLLLIVGVGAGVYLVQQQQEFRERAQVGEWCNPDPPGTDYGSPCSPNGAIDCGADGKETVCQNGTWHATGNCCGSPPPPPGGNFDLYVSGGCIKADNATGGQVSVTTACFVCSGPLDGDGCNEAQGEYLRSCGGGFVAVPDGASGQNVICEPSLNACENFQADAQVTGGGESEALLGEHPTQGGQCNPTNTPTPPVGSAACLGVTGTLPNSSVVDPDTQLTYTASSDGTNLTQVEVCFHGNFEGPGWSTGWQCLRDLDPQDETYPISETGAPGNPPFGSDFSIRLLPTAHTRFSDIKTALVASGHNANQIDQLGIIWAVNVFQQNGDSCFSLNEPGCSVPSCHGNLTLTSSPTLTPTPPQSTPTTPPGAPYCHEIRAYVVEDPINNPANWHQLTFEQLGQLQAEDDVYFTVRGWENDPINDFDRARFTINGSTTEVTTLNTKPPAPGDPDEITEFYKSYKIPANTYSFTVEAQVHLGNIWY